MRLADLPTPCLVLERRILGRNLDTMARAVNRHGVALRPHMKTAKSIDVARLANVSAITVSTLAEAEYFVGHGMADILYAVGITPQKLEQVTKLNATGAHVMVVTDDTEMAGHVGAQPLPPRVLIEVDCGEHRGGLAPDDPLLLEIASRLGACLQGVMTHAGHSYAGRTAADMARFAEAERSAAVYAADRLRAAGFACPIVSGGSSPTAHAAASLAGLTEMRPGVYMFGDLFQAEIGTHSGEDIALSVLASVIGRRPSQNRILIDAGAIALSKDRSTEATGNDLGFGLMVDVLGRASFGRAIVRQAYQEHGVVELDANQKQALLPIGSKVRILPNHVCLTAAAHDRYFVVDEGDEVVAIWPRVNGW